MFTNRHYEFLAKTLRDTQRDGSQHEREAAIGAAVILADAFCRQSSIFDRDRWFAACNPHRADA